MPTNERNYEKNITLGRGRLFFDAFAPGTNTTTGERYIGSTMGFNLNAESQDAKHYDMEGPIRVQDANVVTQVDYMGNLSTDQIDPDNVAMFFFGSSSAVVQASAVAESENRTVLQGMNYQIGQTTDNPMGLRLLSNVTVTDSGAATTYAEGDDYIVDLAKGRIWIVSGGDIANGASEEIVINYDVAAYSRERTLSGRDQIRGTLRFIADNSVGDNADYFFPNVVIRPNGEFGLKSESDFQNLQFTAEFLTLGDTPAVIRDTAPVAS